MKTFETEKSNIPEGATHYTNETKTEHFAWYKKVDGVPFISLDIFDKEWRAMDDEDFNEDDSVLPIPLEYLKEQEPKKLQWDGVGLPPVGLMCEVYGALGNYDEWQECKIFAIVHGQIFISNEDSWVNRPVGWFKFRPIETHKQKEDRQKLEAAYSLYEVYMEENDPDNIATFKQFKNNIHTEAYKGFLNIVTKFCFNKMEDK